jgi:hypothetical protein
MVGAFRFATASMPSNHMLHPSAGQHVVISYVKPLINLTNATTLLTSLTLTW